LITFVISTIQMCFPIQETFPQLCDKTENVTKIIHAIQSSPHIFTDILLNPFEEVSFVLTSILRFLLRVDLIPESFDFVKFLIRVRVTFD
jgi:hypothetical protein